VQRSVTVKKLTVHLPVAEAELPLCATTEAGPVSTALTGEGAAQVRVPATKYPRHKTGEFSGQRLHDLFTSLKSFRAILQNVNAH